MSDLADEIRGIVKEVLKSPEIAALLEKESSGGAEASAAATSELSGIFPDIDSAIAAATIAQRQLIELPLDTRRAMIDAMRRVIIWNNRELSTQAVEETGLGNIEDKQVKNLLAATKTPGVEDLEPMAWSDEHGLTITERAPWGVIGAITPMTNPISSITSNGIGMIAAGNSVVFNVHPNAKEISCRLIHMFNNAIVSHGGPENLLCAVRNPTIDTAAQLMKHPGIALLVVTGGPGVVAAAMVSGKKAICAGPGNPPCVVDETADIDKAGRDIVLGASFDNNVVCICEKEVLAVASIADKLKMVMKENGAYELTGSQIDAVTNLVIAVPGGPQRDGAPNKAFVGKSAHYIAAAAGIDVPTDTRLLLMEVSPEHPLVWTEQLMPVLPLVRMSDVDRAIDFAVEVEKGCRHSSMMHSRNIEKLSRMAKLMNGSLFIKNGPCYAGLGQGGAGFTSFTIASPTGEGVTRPRTFTRERRCTLVDAFRII